LVTKELRRKESAAIRRDAILKAARCTFAQKGFADTNVEDIAVRAGVAKGTLYLYFNSKEEIYMAALREEAQRLDTITRERIEVAPTWQDKVRAYVDVRLEYLESHHEFVRIYLAEIRSMMLRGAPIGTDCFRMVRESEVQLAQVFAAAAAQGQIRTVDPELAALTVVDLTRGLLERRLLGWCRTEGACDVSFTIDLLCHALAADDSKQP
jgi:AcrR family transcriptional regulator